MSRSVAQSAIATVFQVQQHVVEIRLSPHAVMVLEIRNAPCHIQLIVSRF